MSDLMSRRDDRGPTSTLKLGGFLSRCPRPQTPQGWTLGVTTRRGAPTLICGDLGDSKLPAYQVKPGCISTSGQLVSPGSLTARKRTHGSLDWGGVGGLPLVYLQPERATHRRGGLAEARPPRAGARSRGPAPGSRGGQGQLCSCWVPQPLKQADDSSVGWAGQSVCGDVLFIL